MSRKQKELEMKAMKLDWESRAKLTERLLLSLERESEAEIERLWMEEAQRRLAEIRDGRVLPVPAAQVLRRVRRELSRKRSGSKDGRPRKTSK